jgi:hypothetical protein
MSLHEKEVDFDTVLINLRDKPEWYIGVASNNQTPAVRLDGKYMCESLDILWVRHCAIAFQWRMLRWPGWHTRST